MTKASTKKATKKIEDLGVKDAAQVKGGLNYTKIEYKN